MASLSSNQIKFIRSLSQKKFRQETGLFVAEGEKILSVALTEHNEEEVTEKPEEADADAGAVDEKEVNEVNEVEEIVPEENSEE